jgi:hypothetical protein
MSGNSPAGNNAGASSAAPGEIRRRHARLAPDQLIPMRLVRTGHHPLLRTVSAKYGHASASLPADQVQSSSDSIASMSASETPVPARICTRSPSQALNSSVLRVSV